jgi:excisionase family DNA binding protein
VKSYWAFSSHDCARDSSSDGTPQQFDYRTPWRDAAQRKIAMSEKDRMIKLFAANPKTLARIDAILDGSDTTPTPVDMDCRTITFTEAARRLGVSRPTIYRLTRAGRLAVVPLGGVNRIKLQSVFDYFANGKANADKKEVL